MDVNILILSSLLIAVLAGTLGSFLGLGGGFIIVPALTLIIGVPIHLAIGASFIGVLANSNSASIVYLKEGLTDVRLGTLLEVGALAGAIVGATFALSLDSDILSVIFGLALLYGGFAMIRGRRTSPSEDSIHKTATPSKTNSSHLGRSSNSPSDYEPRRIRQGIGLSIMGGVFAGLLGVGGGSVLVPILVRVIGVPMKIAVATSSYIIGITASAGALIFLSQGAVDIVIAIPTALGVFFGAQLGSRAVKHVRVDAIRILFVIAVVFISLQMVANGIGLSALFLGD